MRVGSASAQGVEQPGGELRLLDREVGAVRDVVEREDDPLHPGVEQGRELRQQRASVLVASVVDVEAGRQREAESGAVSLCVLRERAELVDLRGVVGIAPTIAMLRVALRRVHIRVHAAFGDELDHREAVRG